MKKEPSETQLATAYIRDRLDRMDKARRRVARRRSQTTRPLCFLCYHLFQYPHMTHDRELAYLKRLTAEDGPSALVRTFFYPKRIPRTTLHHYLTGATPLDPCLREHLKALKEKAT